MGSNAKWAVVAVAVGVLGIGGVVFLQTRESSSRELETLIQALRASGQPVTLAELDAFYDLGVDAERAGKDLSTILALISQPADAEHVLYVSADDLEVGAPIPQQTLADSRRHLAANRDILGRLHEILRDGLRVRYPVDLTLGADAPLDYLAPIRSGTRLLALEATLAAIDGDTAKSTRSLTKAIALADSLRDEPLLISQLVRVACLGIASGAIEESVNRSAFSTSQIHELERALSSLRLDGMISRALVGDRTWGMADVMSIPAEGRPMLEFWIESEQIDASTAALFKRRGYYERETVQLIHDYNELITLGDIPPPDRVAAGERLEAAILGRTDDGNRLSKATMPMLVNALEVEIRASALVRVTVAGLAAMRYQKEASLNPTSLESIVPDFLPAVPIDPFTGAALRHRTIAGGFVVYSVGPDLDDDRGEPRPDGVSLLDDGDISFRMTSGN